MQNVFNIISTIVLLVSVIKKIQTFAENGTCDISIISTILMILAIFINTLSFIYYNKNKAVYFKDYLAYKHLRETQPKLRINSIITISSLFMITVIPPFESFVLYIINGDWLSMFMEAVLFIPPITGFFMLTRKKIGYISAFINAFNGIVCSLILFFYGKIYSLENSITGDAYHSLMTFLFLIVVATVIFESLIALYYILNRKKYILNTTVEQENIKIDDTSMTELDKCMHNASLVGIKQHFVNFTKQRKNFLIPVVSLFLFPTVLISSMSYVENFIDIDIGMCIVSAVLTIIASIIHIIFKKKNKQLFSDTRIKPALVIITALFGLLCGVLSVIIDYVPMDITIIEMLIYFLGIPMLLFVAETIIRECVQFYLTNINKWVGIILGVLCSPFMVIALMTLTTMETIWPFLFSLIFSVLPSLTYHKTKNITYGVIANTLLSWSFIITSIILH